MFKHDLTLIESIGCEGFGATGKTHLCVVVIFNGEKIIEVKLLFLGHIS